MAGFFAVLCAGPLLVSTAEAAAFLYRKPLTIQGAEVGAAGAPHAAFPVLVRLTDPNLKSVTIGGPCREHARQPRGLSPHSVPAHRQQHPDLPLLRHQHHCLPPGPRLRIVLAMAPRLLSNDVNRHVGEGRIQLHGGNPYAWDDRPNAPRWVPPCATRCTAA